MSCSVWELHAPADRLLVHATCGHSFPFFQPIFSSCREKKKSFLNIASIIRVFWNTKENNLRHCDVEILLNILYSKPVMYPIIMSLLFLQLFGRLLSQRYYIPSISSHLRESDVHPPRQNCPKQRFIDLQWSCGFLNEHGYGSIRGSYWAPAISISFPEARELSCYDITMNTNESLVSS